MKKKLITYGIVAILLGSASLVSVSHADNTAIVNKSGNVSYVSGGVGTESLDQLGSMAREFNLKLVFALNSGEFLSDVRVLIKDAKGKTILEALSEGPWFLTRLPAGNYQVVATLAGKAEKRQIAVAAATQKTIDFRWKSE